MVDVKTTSMSRSIMIYFVSYVDKACTSMDTYQPTVLVLPHVHPFLVPTHQGLYDLVSNLCDELGSNLIYDVKTVRNEDDSVEVYVNDSIVVNGVCTDELIDTAEAVVRRETAPQPRNPWLRTET
jgi:hypothetical protein